MAISGASYGAGRPEAPGRANAFLFHYREFAALSIIAA